MEIIISMFQEHEWHNFNNMYSKTKTIVSNGAHFSVDFKNRTLRINSKEVNLNGVDLGVEQYNDLDKWLDEVENLYDNYKYSRPTKTSMSKERRAKFKALSVSQLIKECGHDALSNPISRDEAQAALEVFILFSLINGSFKPEELFAKDWYYQGSDKTLVIYKNWF